MSDAHLGAVERDGLQISGWVDYALPTRPLGIDDYWRRRTMPHESERLVGETLMEEAREQMAEKINRRNKCADGEHEADWSMPLLPMPSQSGHEARPSVCRHCRCLYVPR